MATSSVVPIVELELGVARLRDAGLSVRVHEQCSRQHFTFAGTDPQRAEAFFEYATSQDIDVIWCARGGYGATRILPLLEQMTRERGKPPRKLLIGYSDVTALHEFVRKRWDWCTLHATMPGALNFDQIHPIEWRATLDWVRGLATETPWPEPLKFLTPCPAQPLEGELVGGNLTLWACLAGTPYAPSAAGKILFFEEVGEPWYRIDRMITQIEQAGMLAGAQAILLGDFKDCRDETHRVLKQPGSIEKAPMRPSYSQTQALEEIFGALGQRLAIPVATGLPAGHGPHFAPLPLGAHYQLSPQGTLYLTQWDWLT
ncbi:MAG: S66 peptidase family protein [Bacillota bacterium]